MLGNDDEKILWFYLSFPKVTYLTFPKHFQKISFFILLPNNFVGRSIRKAPFFRSLAFTKNSHQRMSKTVHSQR